jgi:multidrug efflux pump subunit AcrB
MISAVNALTLSPALCALFLNDPQGEHGEHGHKKGLEQDFSMLSMQAFNNMTRNIFTALSF